MVDQTPRAWQAVSNQRWDSIDEVEYVTGVMANGQWTTATLADIEVSVDDNGWLRWREPDLSAGGALPPQIVVHVEWAVP